MKNRRNYYRILQVQPDAPVEIIRASHRTLLLQLKKHPDLGGDVYDAQLLNEAYATLSDERKRLEYDKKLYEKYTRSPFPGAASGKRPLITFFCPFCKRPLARAATPAQCCPSCRSPLRSFYDNDREDKGRRSVMRTKKTGKIYVYTRWPQKKKVATMVDLSPDGMRFRCEDALPRGAVIKISSAPLKAIARVKNVHKLILAGTTLYEVGVRFLSVTFAEAKGAFYSAKT